MALQGSLWDELQRHGEEQIALEFDVSEIEALFTSTVQKLADKSGGRLKSVGAKPERVQLIELRRANHIEIMLTKVKMPLPDMMDAVLVMDDSVLDVDQIENIRKFCPTKEEMELLKNYTGDKATLEKSEQYFLELMKVPRVESKLRVFSFKIQFSTQITELKNSLNVVNSACEEVRTSQKLKEIMKNILYLGNTLNQGTKRGSAVGFKLESLSKLSDKRAAKSKKTLLHYLCKVLDSKAPDLLDFHKDLESLESASKIQLKSLAEEMQAIAKGLKKSERELSASESDDPVSETLKDFISGAQTEYRTVTSLYYLAGRNADALALYFGEDPSLCPFEQVTANLWDFIRLFKKAHKQNVKQAELEKKKTVKKAVRDITGDDSTSSPSSAKASPSQALLSGRTAPPPLSPPQPSYGSPSLSKTSLSPPQRRLSRYDGPPPPPPLMCIRAPRPPPPPPRVRAPPPPPPPLMHRRAPPPSPPLCVRAPPPPPPPLMHRRAPPPPPPPLIRRRAPPPPPPMRGRAPPPPTLMHGRVPPQPPPPPPPMRRRAPPPPPPPLIRRRAPPPPPLMRERAPPPPTLMHGRVPPQPPPPPPPMCRRAPPPPPPPPPMRRKAPPPPPPPPPPMHGRAPPPPTSMHGRAPPPPPPLPPRRRRAPPPPPPLPTYGVSGVDPEGAGRGTSLARQGMGSSTKKKSSLKPLHWVKLSRASKGSLWNELQRHGEGQIAPEFDLSEIESFFSADKSVGAKPERGQLIDLGKAINTEIMLVNVKMPLPDMMAAILAMDDSVLNVDQIENLIKFCPTREEMDLLKKYTGDKATLGKCEQYFLELMKVPRVESKLRVFYFKIQFSTQITEFTKSLNMLDSACEEVRNSQKLKEILKRILYLENILEKGTTRGVAVGFKLKSLLRLCNKRALKSNMTLMHYLCKVLESKAPDLLDFHKDLESLESASKIQLKYLVVEMQAIIRGLENLDQELVASETDGPISEVFRKKLKAFIPIVETEMETGLSLLVDVQKNADELLHYFGEDPNHCTFDEVIGTLFNFIRLFKEAHEENVMLAELEKIESY